MLHDDKLTNESAVKHAREWGEGRLDKRKGGQFQSLFWELAMLCIAEAVRVGGGEYELNERLQAAYDVLYELQNFGFPSKLEKHRWEDIRNAPDDLHVPLKSAMASVWRRRDPLRSMKEGYESDHYFNGPRAQLHEDLGTYLSLRWLRHPSVDWIFLDMMITRELCPLAEELKQKYFPGKKDSMAVHHKYWTAKGNVKNMAAVSGLGRIMGPSREFTDPSSPFSKTMHLWETMYDAWRALTGPVVNPTVVRDEMIKSKNEGAVWDVPSWALIERVIEFDRAVWLVPTATAVAR